MAYATKDDVDALVTPSEEQVEELLERAALIIDAIAPKASEDAKRMVSASMVARAVPSGSTVPYTQMTQSAGPYSKTWTFPETNGQVYLTKWERLALGIGRQSAFGLRPAQMEDSDG